jgi:probable addiction module antidote protein
MSAHLSEALESGSKDRIVEAINAVARARGMTTLANATGLNRTVLYSALRVGGNPKLATLLTIINGLGLKLTAKAASDIDETLGGAGS